MRGPTLILLAIMIGCTGGSKPPPSEAPPPARAFMRPAPDPKAAMAQFAERARAKGCKVEELSTGALAHCPDAMIAVEPRGAEIQIECYEMAPTACAPIFDAILNAAPPAASASDSASTAPSPSAPPPAAPVASQPPF